MSGTSPSEWTRQTIKFIDPRETPFIPLQTRGELPHLYKGGGSYFVTFRLWDAVLPATQRTLWRTLHERFRDPEGSMNRQLAIDIAQSTELSITTGSCLLNRSEAANSVQNALLHFHDERYQLAAWCVMPNHVHMAYTTLSTFTPDSIHHSWKSYTAVEINTLLSRSGTLWERESFDHLIRSVEHYQTYIEYIERNPVVGAAVKMT